MKTLLSLLVLSFIAMGIGENNEPKTSAKKAIVSESFATPVAFGFGQNYYLDADKDGQSDFLFTTVYENEGGNIHTKYVVNAIGENEILTVDQDAAIADTGSSLDSFGNITWNNAPASILEQVTDEQGNSWKGLWSGDRDQYVGIKVVKDGKSYTGWVKIFIDQSSETAKVQGYALNQSAGNTINAGEI